MFWWAANRIRRAKFRYDEPAARSGAPIFWWSGRRNFGDALNPIIAQHCGAADVGWVPHTCSSEHFQIIGSILQKANRHTVVWGSGFIDEHLNPYDKPKAVLAVRGPLTGARLRNMGVSCPEVYGDPALLMPHFYRPAVEIEYELGVIPHYSDAKTPFFNQCPDPRVKVIDVEQEGCEGFIRDILSCRRIASSSLHGIIIADAYGIPSVRVSFAKRSVFGGDFKFFDYFQSVNREPQRALPIGDRNTWSDLLEIKLTYDARFDPERLMRTSPFL